MIVPHKKLIECHFTTSTFETLGFNSERLKINSLAQTDFMLCFQKTQGPFEAHILYILTITRHVSDKLRPSGISCTRIYLTARPCKTLPRLLSSSN